MNCKTVVGNVTDVIQPAHAQAGYVYTFTSKHLLTSEPMGAGVGLHGYFTNVEHVCTYGAINHVESHKHIYRTAITKMLFHIPPLCSCSNVCITWSHCALYTSQLG